MQLMHDNIIHPVAGIFWGKFDPITHAHQAIIEKATTYFSLKTCVVVVNNYAHVTYHAPITHRIEMIKNVVTSSVRIIIQDEAHEQGYFTLKKQLNKPLVAFFGEDSFLEWKKREDFSLKDYDKLVLFKRDIKQDSFYASSPIEVVSLKEYGDVSSSAAREAIKARNPLMHYYISQKTGEYIKRNGLYAM